MKILRDVLQTGLLPRHEYAKVSFYISFLNKMYQKERKRNMPWDVFGGSKLSFGKKRDEEQKSNSVWLLKNEKSQTGFDFSLSF